MKPNDTPPPTDDPKANNAAGAGCMARIVRGSFTPGPWRREDAHSASHYIHAPGKRQLYFLGASTSIPIAEHLANAELIASAPDMVEALERIRDYQGRFGEDDPQSIASDILGKIYSANAKRIHPRPQDSQ